MPVAVLDLTEGTQAARMLASVTSEDLMAREGMLVGPHLKTNHLQGRIRTETVTETTKGVVTKIPAI